MQAKGFVSLILLLSASCAHTAAPESPATAAATSHEDLAFIQAACAGCHAVEPLHLSPNPIAPTFVEIVNREGVTRRAMHRFLSDAHNYPEVMDFDLEEHHVDLLTDYMLTLKDPERKLSPY